MECVLSFFPKCREAANQLNSITKRYRNDTVLSVTRVVIGLFLWGVAKGVDHVNPSIGWGLRAIGLIVMASPLIHFIKYMAIGVFSALHVPHLLRR